MIEENQEDQFVQNVVTSNARQEVADYMVSSNSHTSWFPKQIIIAESSLLDVTTIHVFLRHIKSISKKSVVLSQTIENSMAFIQEVGSFQTILSMEPTHISQPFQMLVRNYKLHYSYLHSVQAIAYLGLELYNVTDTTATMAKIEHSFQMAFQTIMSDLSLYSDSSNSIMLAWIWATLGVASVSNFSKLSLLSVCIKHVEAFLDKHLPKEKSVSLFGKTSSSSMRVSLDDPLHTLLSMKNYLRVMNLIGVDEEFAHASILEIIGELKKVIHFDLHLFNNNNNNNMEMIYTTICRIIELLESIQVTFSISGSSLRSEELENMVVPILSCFDNLVATFLQIPEYHDKKFWSMFLSIYELKLRFIEELKNALLENLEHVEIIANLDRARLNTANQILNLVKQNELLVSFTAQYNVRRSILKIVEIYMELPIVNVESIQHAFSVLCSIQQTSLHSPAVDQMIQKVLQLKKETLQELVEKVVTPAAELQLHSVLQDESSVIPHSELSSSYSFLGLEDILNDIV